MALVDEIEIYLCAGKGGDGVVRWRHEKNKEFGGPAGGDGGKGGDVYARAIRDISALARYRGIKEFHAENGAAGKSGGMHGRNGESLSLEMPVGSVVVNQSTGERFELLHDGQQNQLLAGGAGGLGNMHFKGPINQRPKESTPGKAGESADFSIELQLIADAGLIGLPNAGKSSLLNALTKAHAKIGSYAFTTLEPNLGAMNGFILADIPGLIEGASEGKGLGHRFLRHIRRTRMLVHCISVEQENIPEAYRAVRGELGKYDKELLSKPEVVVLTKSDLISESRLQEMALDLKTSFPNMLSVSSFDTDSLERLSRELWKHLDTAVAKTSAVS